MRLLNVWSGQFVEKDPRDPETKYAILSHTWDSDGEQTYQELTEIQKRYPPEDQLAQSPDDVRVESGPPSPGHPPSCAPLNTSTTHDTSPTVLSSLDLKSSSPAPSCSPSSSIQSTAKTLGVVSPYDAPQDRPESVLSPMWDDPKLSPKIREACRVARGNGHDYLWIDSCCIDKTSSSELSEAINSMYHWYSRAVVCYAFLADVRAHEDHEKTDSEFRRSRWFTRGWTLQELIAPIDVWFLSKEWTFIRSKHGLANLVTDITGIDRNALLRVEPLKEFSVAQRLSWAATRQTTRVEDRAYSLLGIFDINMPTLYGEGHRAFRRLQEEILQHIPDQTLFAWTLFSLDSPTEHHKLGSIMGNNFFYLSDYSDFGSPSLSFFAPSPDVFADCRRLEPLSRKEVARRLQRRLHLPAADYYSTPYGIRTQFPVIPFSVYFPPRRFTTSSYSEWDPPLTHWYLAILECEHKDYPGHLLGRVCYTRRSDSGDEFSYCGYVELRVKATPYSYRSFDLLPLPPTSLNRLHPPRIKFHTVYIPHPDERDGTFSVARWTPHETINLVLLKSTRDALHAKGYMVDLRGPDDVHPTTHRLTLSHKKHIITFEYQHSLEGCSSSQKLTIESTVTISNYPCGVSSVTVSLPWGEILPLRHRLEPDVDIPGIPGFWIREELSLAAKDYYAIHIDELQPIELLMLSWMDAWRSRIDACRFWLWRQGLKITWR